MVAGPFDAERTDTDAQVAADRTAVQLGLLGILPFLVLSFWLAAITDGHPWRATTILLLTQYAAIVLSFLGGIRWGLALRRASPARAQELAMTMLPPLVAWASLSVPLPTLSPSLPPPSLPRVPGTPSPSTPARRRAGTGGCAAG